MLGLVAIGFSYIFRVTKVFHLAHGGIYVVGAYSCWWAEMKTQSWFISIIFAFAIVTILITILEKSVYLQINKRKSNESISLIASSGLYVIIINILALLFGNENKVFENGISGTFLIGQLIITKVQLIQLIAGIGSIVILIGLLSFTKSKLTLQAISDNEIISKTLGINTNRERLKVFVLGSILASIAAILNTIDTGIDLHSGMKITLSAAVVTILIGRSNPLLIMLSSISLLLLQNIVEWFMNAQWRDGVTFFILLIVILFRTEGILSYNLRKDRA